MAISATGPDDYAEQLLTLTTKLTTLIEQETALFEARTPLEAAAFRDEKSKLANLYRQEIARLAKDRRPLEGLSAHQRDMIAESSQKLTAALEAHGAALATLQELTEGLVRSVADFVTQKQNQSTGYSRKASVPAKPPAGGGLALDQSA